MFVDKGGEYSADSVRDSTADVVGRCVAVERISRCANSASLRRCRCTFSTFVRVHEPAEIAQAESLIDA